MKGAIFAGLITIATLSSHAVASPPASLVFEPVSLLEELRTGVITISDEKLTTELGTETKLKLIKTVEMEYETLRLDYEVVGTDAIRLCDDGSEASYLSIALYDGSTVLEAYQIRSNPENNNEYVSHCADYRYLPHK